jgi:MFS family permease
MRTVRSVRSRCVQPPVRKGAAGWIPGRRDRAHRRRGARRSHRRSDRQGCNDCERTGDCSFDVECPHIAHSRAAVDRQGTNASNPAEGRYPIAALALALMLCASLMPTPLFQLYKLEWGLSPAEISLVFAIYAGSLIPSLLFLGGVSDRIGRRRTILFAFAMMALAALIFAFAHGLVWLIVARIVQGFAIGIGAGAATAAIREWMHERDRERAGAVAVVSVGIGSATGAILGGTLAQYGPDPQSLPFFVYLVLVAGGALAVSTVPTCPHLQSLSAAHSRTVSVPPAIRRPFLILSVQAFIGWASFAILIALVPTFLDSSLNLHTLLTGAFVVTGLQVGSVTASLIGDRWPSRMTIIAGMILLGAGVWMLLLAVPLHAYALIVVATIVVGAGGGLSYLVGLNVIGEIAPAEHRAETLSAFLVACYLGFSIPALAVGIAATWFGFYASFIGAAILLGVIAVWIMVFTSEENLRPVPVAVEVGQGRTGQQPPR